MAFNEFMANNHLASRIQQYRYIDYDQFHQMCTEFNKENLRCKEKKMSLSDNMIKGMFLLLDTDDSGELEPEEILGVLQDRMLFAQNREQKMKDDMWAKVIGSIKAARTFVTN